MPKPTIYQQAVEAIHNKKPVILHGSPGIGKTYSAEKIAKDIGFSVIETNASDSRRKEDLQNVYQSATSELFVPSLFLFDEADGMEDFSVLEKILTESHYPILITCNKIEKIPRNIQDLCEVIRFYDPKLIDVVDIVKQAAKDMNIQKPDFSNINSGDIRHGLLTTLYGGDKYNIQYINDVIQALLRGEKPDLSNQELHELQIWLIDNMPRFYFGLDIIKSYSLLVQSALYQNVDILKFLPEGRGTVVFPNYYARMRSLREKRPEHGRSHPKKK